jgi:uncharacterized membrane protein HdeD (DUF308 family)
MQNMSDEHDKKIEAQQKAEREKVEKEKKERQKEMEKERKETKEQYEKGQKQSEKDLKQKEDKIRKKEKQKPYKTSMGMRVLNLVVGIVLLLSPIYIFLNEDIVLDTALLVFGIIMLLSGLARFFNAFYEKEIGGTTRLFRFIIGVLLIVIAIIAFIHPDIGENTLLMFIAFAIAIQGLGRILLGLKHDTFPFWLKVTMIILGLVSIGIAISAFSSFAIGSFDIAQNDLINIFAAAFFVGGISRLGQGLAGLNQEKSK